MPKAAFGNDDINIDDEMTMINFVFKKLMNQRNNIKTISVHLKPLSLRLPFDDKVIA
jgi:hypothetical protein